MPAIIVAKLLPRSFGESVAEYQTKQLTIMLADATGAHIRIDMCTYNDPYVNSSPGAVFCRENVLHVRRPPSDVA